MASLSNFYSPISFKSSASSTAQHMFSPVTADLNNDGNQDLILLGANYPLGSITNVAQPGTVLFGDGRGGFSVASQSIFPWQSLLTVHPRKVIIADINSDGTKDVFISCHGWDTAPFPGEQNHLFLSKKDGTWYDATSKLPKLNDYSHTSAIADINGDKKLDIFVGNGYGGQNNIFSYVLENQANDTFKLNRANIPSKNSTLDFTTAHQFPGANLVDINGDDLPELIITPDASESFDKNRATTIFWNTKGKFSESNKTLLSAPVGTNNQIGLDAQATDINGDGLKDLIEIGTQGQPFYDGWFVQIFLNEGNKKFVDMTSTFLSAQDSFGGIHGEVSGEPWPAWINIFDFNHDGINDFWLEFGNPKTYTPIVWLNDGTGHFTTLKVSDFVDSADQYLMGYHNHFYQTNQGWSFVSIQHNNDQLSVGGLLATTPYTSAIPTENGKILFGESTNDSLSGSINNDTFYGGLGNDTLQGGLGSDTFVFNSILNGKTNVDTITDFTAGIDKLQLSKSIFKSFSKDASVSQDNFINGTISIDKNDYLVYDKATGKLFYDADGNGKAAAIQIAVIGTDTHAALTSADFIVV